MKRKYTLKGKYPCKANWVIIKKRNGKFIVRNCAIEEELEMSPHKVQYLQSLDGYTNPLEVDGYTIEECKEYYLELESEFLIREGKTTDLGYAKLHTIFIPKQMKSKSLIPKFYNLLLMLLCVPVFVLGLKSMINESSLYISDDFMVLGIILGIILGSIFHEISHAMACLAYGGRLVESGIMINGFLPGAYCIIDQATVSKRNNKLKKIQIALSGVEMNLLLLGVFLFLMSLSNKIYFLEMWSGMFFMCALQNFALVLTNLNFVEGFDGEHIMGFLLGNDSIVHQAKSNISCLFSPRKRRRYFRKKGVNGIANICVSCVIIIFQAIIPMFVLAEIGGVFYWIVDIIL